MARLRWFAAIVLVSVGSVGLSETDSSETPTPPWGPASDSTTDESIAAWARETLASPPTPAPTGPTSAAGNAIRGGAKPNALPTGNPLRPVGDSGPLRNAAQPAAPTAREAFEVPSDALPPRPFAPDRAAPPQRIEVGAQPLRALPGNVAPATEAPASEPFTNNVPTPDSISRPPLAWDAQQSEARVASAAIPTDAGWDDDRPAAFQPPAELQSTPISADAGGVGQPGPPELEGPQSATLVIEKRASPSAQVGKPCRFAIRVRNTGAATADEVVIRDQIPAGARLIGTTPTADQADGRLTWRLGRLAPGAEQTVEMRLMPLREGPIGSVATVSIEAAASAQTTVTRPQLAMTVQSGPQTRRGETHALTIELHNPGTGPATGVMLTGDLPRGVSHPAGAELEFEVGELAAGETRRIDLDLTAVEAGPIVSQLSVTADGDLRAERTVEFEVVAPALEVAIDGPSRRYLERPASYTISVGNPGTAAAEDVRLVTHLPRAMEFVRANNLGEYDAQTHSVYWSLAELPEGQRGQVEVVAMPLTSGEHMLRVESEATGGLKAENSRPVVVDGVASLAFEVRDLADPIEVGGETTYEIRVHNEGTKAATNVHVAIEAPDGVRFTAAQGDTAHRVAAQRVEFAPIPQLKPGAKASFKARVSATKAGDQRITVSVNSDDLSRPIRREESTRVFDDE